MNKYLFFVPVFIAFACKHEPFENENQTDNPQDTVTNFDPDSDCDPDTVYFANDVLPLLQANCATAGCHDAATAQDGVILIDYQSIMSTADVQPGDADASDLYEVLTENDPDKRMPPPPRAPIAADQINNIKIWIEQGAKNNACTGCDTTNVTYRNQIVAILQQNCYSCHSGSAPTSGTDLSTHANLVNGITNGMLLNRIKHLPGSNPMPPYAKLSDCNIETVENWINQGMPNN